MKVVLLLLQLMSTEPAAAPPGPVAPTSPTSTAEPLVINGKDLFGSKVIPAEVVGTYQYELRAGQLGEPLAEFRSDGTGYFQPHMAPKIAIEYWMLCDAQGNIHKNAGPTGNYEMVLLVKWKEASTGNRPLNTFSVMSVAIALDEGKAILLRERFKRLDPR